MPSIFAGMLEAKIKVTHANAFESGKLTKQGFLGYLKDTEPEQL